MKIVCAYKKQTEMLFILDFKLSPCSEFCMLSSGQFPGAWILYADVSYLPAYEDGTGRVLQNVGM